MSLLPTPQGTQKMLGGPWEGPKPLMFRRRKKLHDRLGDDFLDMPPKAQAQSKNKLTADNR